MERRGLAKHLPPAQSGVITGIYWTVAWPIGMTLFYRTHPITISWFLRGLIVGTLMGLTMGIATYRRHSERDGQPITVRRTWILAAVPFLVLAAVAVYTFVKGSVIAGIVVLVAGIIFMLIAAGA